jgi:hypothetical protein
MAAVLPPMAIDLLSNCSRKIHTKSEKKIDIIDRIWWDWPIVEE